MNVFGTEHTSTEHAMCGGVQHKFKFDNGYGASVVQHDFSYGHEDGKWELAVFKGKHITYDTPITDDVLGWLSEEDVAVKLAEIEALPKVGA